MTKPRLSPRARNASTRTAIARARAALLTAFATASVLATTWPALAADPPGIPAGQDALMAAMFGAGVPLPGGCRFESGEAVLSVVRVVYSCQTGPVVIGLAHPGGAPGPTLRTAKFSIVLEGGNAPAGLAEALVTLIRAGEANFAWFYPGEEE